MLRAVAVEAIQLGVTVVEEPGRAAAGAVARIGVKSSKLNFRSRCALSGRESGGELRSMEDRVILWSPFRTEDPQDDGKAA